MIKEINEKASVKNIYLIILILVSALLAVACAYDVYFLHGEGHDEVVFRYISDIRTAVVDPHVYASKFKLRGDLHIRNGEFL